MVDTGKKAVGTDLCSLALADTRRVPIETWIREAKPVIEKLTEMHGKKEATYAAFGATALGALGYTRTTKDVDIVIKAESKSFKDVASEIARDFSFTICENEKVCMLVKEVDGYYFVIELWDDFIYVMNCDDQMWRRARVAQGLGIPMLTLSVEDMIASKLGRYFVNRRSEDIVDISFLLKQYGIADYTYFIERIQKIKREGKTIDDFLFEEILKISEILGRDKTVAFHSQIAARRPYKQLLEKIMFKIAKDSKEVKEVADKAMLNAKEANQLLKILEIKAGTGGFGLPQHPDAIIAKVLRGE